jgi:hypothetical protein
MILIENRAALGAPASRRQQVPMIEPLGIEFGVTVADKSHFSNYSLILAGETPALPGRLRSREKYA